MMFVLMKQYLFDNNGKKIFYQFDLIKLINMLVERLKPVSSATKIAKNDTDVFIVKTAIEESQHQRTAVIIGEDN